MSSNPHHPDPWANVRNALQYLLDAEDSEGWQLDHFIVCMGLTRMDQTGAITSTAWMAIPAEQPDYITDGLLLTAEDMRAGAVVSDDD